MSDDGWAAPGRLSTLVASLVGGVMGTLVMTAFRAPTARSLPPTAALLSRWLGGSDDDYPVSGLALHFLYGVAGALPFGFGWRRLATDEPEVLGLLAGAAYGFALSVFGERVVLPVLVGMDLDTDESAVFHAGHLVYGLTLGAWVGSRSPTD
jgi:hypothetical protein